MKINKLYAYLLLLLVILFSCLVNNIEGFDTSEFSDTDDTSRRRRRRRRRRRHQRNPDDSTDDDSDDSDEDDYDAKYPKECKKLYESCMSDACSSDGFIEGFTNANADKYILKSKIYYII